MTTLKITLELTDYELKDMLRTLEYFQEPMDGCPRTKDKWALNMLWNRLLKAEQEAVKSNDQQNHNAVS